MSSGEVAPDRENSSHSRPPVDNNPLPSRRTVAAADFVATGKLLRGVRFDALEIRLLD